VDELVLLGTVSQVGLCVFLCSSLTFGVGILGSSGLPCLNHVLSPSDPLGHLHALWQHCHLYLSRVGDMAHLSYHGWQEGDLFWYYHFTCFSDVMVVDG
jgi:hypothetical protein